MLIFWSSCQWTPSKLPTDSPRSSQFKRQCTHKISHSPHLDRCCLSSSRSYPRIRPFQRHIRHSYSPSRYKTAGDAASQLVLSILENIEGTDRGADASEELQNRVQGWLQELEDIGQAQVNAPTRNTVATSRSNDYISCKHLADGD